MNKLSLILLILFFSCKGQDDKKTAIYHKKYLSFYDKTLAAIEKKDAKNFEINYDSTKIYLDSLLATKAKSMDLLQQRLGLLRLNNDLKGMIDTYDILLKNDSLNVSQKQNIKFGKFYCMALTDSILYKKQIQEYYNDYVKEKKIPLEKLLKTPDVYRDTGEISERMKLSYYFEGKVKTLKDFKSISDKIPYKFEYNMIKENLKDRVEFLKFAMDFPIKYDWK